MRFILIIVLGLLARTAWPFEFIALDAQQSANLGIETATVNTTTSAAGMKLPALVVVPNDQLHIVNSQQAGLIKQLLVVEGDAVRTGQDLVRIQSPEFLELQRDYLQLLSKLKLSEINFDRSSRGFKEGVVSEQLMMTARNEYEELSAARNQKLEILKLLGISSEEIRMLEKSKTMVTDFIIRSPIDGVILDQMVAAGERIDAATPIYKIGKLDPLWIEIHAPITTINNSRVGNTIMLPEYNLTGEVITIGKQVHDADQGILIRALVDNSTDLLRPGQFVQVRVMTHNSDETDYFEIDSKALVHIGAQTLVFMEQPGGFQPVEVFVISDIGISAVVSGAIANDSRIAISGTAALKAIMTGIGGES